MSFQVVVGDIVRMKTDAIVNAANTGLRPGGGVCGAIFRSAGFDELEAACAGVGGCAVGAAVITPGFRLPARYVIHAVGPVWQGGSYGEAGLLRSAYTSALCLAKESGCSSIAFPLISSGIFGYPKAEAIDIACKAIVDFLRNHEMDVYLTVLNKDVAALCNERIGNQLS